MSEEIDVAEVVAIVESPVKELKERIRNGKYGPLELEKIHEAEKMAKNRSTAKKFLEKKIDTSYEEVSVDTDLSKQELLDICSMTVSDLKQHIRSKDYTDEQLQEILHAEKTVKDRKTAVEFLKKYAKEQRLREEFEEAQYEFQHLKDNLARLQSEVMDSGGISTDFMDQVEDELYTEEGDLTDEEVEEEIDEITEEESEEETEDSDNDEETGDEENKEEDEDEDVEDEETDEPDEESEEEEDPDVENEMEDLIEEEDELAEKRELAEELGVEMGDEELQEIDIDKLKSMKDEQSRREELIQKMSEDFDEEELRQSSTADLEKIFEDIYPEADEKEEDHQKDAEEIEKEAKEDLQMLMGAIKSKDDGGKERESISDKIDKFKSNITSKLNRGSEDEPEDEESASLDSDKVYELLEEYETTDAREASIKTAHIMKAYLEFALGIDREMTYNELAEELEEYQFEGNQTLQKFFKSMSKDQYTGHIDTELAENALESSKAAVKDLE